MTSSINVETDVAAAAGGGGSANGGGGDLGLLDSVQVLLKPFSHQVGGRASIYCYDKKTLCKPYVARELYFYCNTPGDLVGFLPKFKGGC